MFLQQRQLHINLKRRGEEVYFGYCAWGSVSEMAWKQTWYQPELIGHEMSLYVYVCKPCQNSCIKEGQWRDSVKLKKKTSSLKKNNTGRGYHKIKWQNAWNHGNAKHGIMEFATARCCNLGCFASLRPRFQGKPVLRRAEAPAGDCGWSDPSSYRMCWCNVAVRKWFVDKVCKSFAAPCGTKQHMVFGCCPSPVWGHKNSGLQRSRGFQLFWAIQMIAHVTRISHQVLECSQTTVSSCN